MGLADETREHWTSLLAGGNPWLNAALGSWLDFAASAYGETAPGRQPLQVAGWATGLAPMMSVWTAGFEILQRSAWTWPAGPTENPLARLVGHPAAVVGGEDSTERLAAQAGLALMDFLQVMMSHQAMQAQGWMKALQRFASDFQPKDEPDARRVVVTSLDELLTHWGTVGEAALQEYSRSEGFLQSQAAVLRKSMHHRVAQRRLMEALLRANDLPTLADVDEAFASIHALKGEVRRLRRLATQGVASAAAAGTLAAGRQAETGERVLGAETTA